MKLFNRVIKMGLTGLVFVFAVSATAYAGRAVSITGGPWAIGTVGMSLARTTTGDTFTATNEGDVTSTVYIKVTGASLSPGAGAGADIFVLKHDASGSWSDAITNVGSGIELASLTAAAGQTFDLQFTAPSSTTAEGEQTLTVTLTAGEYVWAPGDPITVSHTAGDGISPVTVDITYGTVVTSISGAEKCWITRNLGATQQATAVDDATAASAGWYWQFNRKQGYAVGPSPAWTITSINESESYTDSGSNASNWNPALDPCALLLGAGWRLPTSGEYTNVDVGTTWSWAFGSDLVLHAAGYLDLSAGALDGRGVFGYYWSSTQGSTSFGCRLNFYSSGSYVSSTSKAYGFSVRCLSD